MYIKPEILQLCSGHYLCQNYPDNWLELSDKDQLKFIEENLEQEIENSLPETIRESIKCAASSTQRYIEDSRSKKLILEFDTEDLLQIIGNDEATEEDALAVIEYIARYGIANSQLYDTITTAYEIIHDPD